MPRKYTRQEAAASFWARVDMSGDCWLWQGPINRQGYGVLRWRDKTDRAHRAAYELAHGVMLDGQFVCHSCDVRACVNPAHLWLGTHLDNMADRDRKGRVARGDESGRRKHPERWPSVQGQENGRARLTDEQVRQIRHRRAAGETLLAIATAFGVGSGTVSNIVKGRTWRHI
jgi:hypothetical protein